jgi:8-oxo-dGTP pyrophosphatase MutT (NUDIX family)
LVEGDETFEQTALRSSGETGLDGELVDEIGHISYNFVPEKGYFKTAHFYLLRHVCGSVDKNDSEVYRVEWFFYFWWSSNFTHIKESILEKAMAMLR